MFGALSVNTQRVLPLTPFFPRMEWSFSAMADPVWLWLKDSQAMRMILMEIHTLDKQIHTYFHCHQLPLALVDKTQGDSWLRRVVNETTKKVSTYIRIVVELGAPEVCCGWAESAVSHQHFSDLNPEVISDLVDQITCFAVVRGLVLKQIWKNHNAFPRPS